MIIPQMHLQKLLPFPLILSLQILIRQRKIVSENIRCLQMTCCLEPFTVDLILGNLLANAPLEFSVGVLLDVLL